MHFYAMNDIMRAELIVTSLLRVIVMLYIMRMSILFTILISNTILACTRVYNIARTNIPAIFKNIYYQMDWNVQIP